MQCPGPADCFLAPPQKQCRLYLALALSGSRDNFEDAIASGQKAAQQITVSGSGTINAFAFHMSSLGAASAELRFYQGGAAPELGTLVGTVTKTTGLNQGNDTYTEFDFATPVSVTAGTYYAVLWIPGQVFNLAGNADGNILSGGLWKYNGAWADTAFQEASLAISYTGTGSCNVFSF